MLLNLAVEINYKFCVVCFDSVEHDVGEGSVKL